MQMEQFKKVLEKIRSSARNTRELGDTFEKMVAHYLQKDPLYKGRFSDIWLWQEWPGRGNQPDTGIDIVARESQTGDYCAIQCKAYDAKSIIQKSDIDSFFTASGRSFATREGAQSFSSRLIVSTTDRWSKHAEKALMDQTIRVSRIGPRDLAESNVDWSTFDPTRPGEMQRLPKKTPRAHQHKAIQDVLEGFQTHDRGKMIMACGTGKTFTALKIAEALARPSGRVLFLVPSISLLSQTLREWSVEAEGSLACFAVCSDTKVGKRSGGEDISVTDLPFLPTTDAGQLAKQLRVAAGGDRLTVVFSTYQSIQVLADAQGHGAPDFDLIICDEAHRTTGVTLKGEDESHFRRVHDHGFIRARKRLYMTATPRIFGDVARAKAREADAELCSMDDEALYGPEFHRLGFGEAVSQGLLSDYKVLVLTVDEKHVSAAMQSQLANMENALDVEDAVKIIGCWNGLAKRIARDGKDAGERTENDNAPMRRAVAFCSKIRDSQQLAGEFQRITEAYAGQFPDSEDLLTCEADHVDGSMNALERNRKLDWLKEDTDGGSAHCRILSNARCLSEGVDVPALDAVLFLSPRNSQVDVVQSVGRVMRRAEGKAYGYVILPVAVRADMDPAEALDGNRQYKVVWQVLQALRAHDDRFDATINKIELNDQPTEHIEVIGVGDGWAEEGDGEGAPVTPDTGQSVLPFPHFPEWRDAIFARIVKKCGDRRYWESWAKDVAQIAGRHVSRIRALLEADAPEHRTAFSTFLKGLRDSLNPAVTEEDAIELLSQHMITRPVFEALFEDYAFARRNPVSQAMQGMLDALRDQSLEKETRSLEKFYDSVRDRAAGIDNAAGRQKVIIELYEKFFRTAFPRTAERLGIVYTPTEVVDYILRSVNDVLEREFGAGIGAKDVHVLDPFTGTGTFMTRLLQSGLIPPGDLPRKYREELHCNEIVLLAYYIAAINIEEAFHHAAGGDYEPFPGIVLTDTFQMTEKDDLVDEAMFPENNARAARQLKTDIRVIIGNPPYSSGRKNENEGDKNLKYPTLDGRIEETYAARSTARLKTGLKDSYIRAIRWATDCIGDTGVICYVSNGSYIDSNVADGLRACLMEEFSSIHCFNLRGNARTQGELRRKEKDSVFGEGTRTPIAITLLVRNPAHHGPCRLHYRDIGDYLKREEKLGILESEGSIFSTNECWRRITPNRNGDWINQRDPNFEKFMPIGDKKDQSRESIFGFYSSGVKTNRDAWVYHSSKEDLARNMRRMISVYNQQMEAYRAASDRVSKGRKPDVDRFVDSDGSKIKWSGDLKDDLSKSKRGDFNEKSLRTGMYRPYFKQNLYFDRMFNNSIYQIPRIFPHVGAENLCIAVSGVGAAKEFSCLITDCIPNLHMHDTGQCFPLYRYERAAGDGLLGNGGGGGHARRDAIGDAALGAFHAHYGDAAITKEDVFYYVYGVLHSPEYRTRFAANLRRMLPRIPFAADFRAFSRAGRALANLHLNYESVEPWPLREETPALPLNPERDCRVEKMTFGKKDGARDKSAIIYNSHVTLADIPPEAHDYIVNGKSALEWVMERYALTRDKASGIVNDPNAWSDDPAYILNLIKRITRVSVETVRIVNALPELKESAGIGGR